MTTPAGRLRFDEAAKQLGIHPLQVLVELASMKQPWEESWPAFDAGFVDTIRERRRARMGLPLAPAKRTSPTQKVPVDAHETLPVGEGAAAILNKLVTKSYGLKAVRTFTLLKKWMHDDATDDDVTELLRRGNLEYIDDDRTSVKLVADRMADTDRIVGIYRRRK